jgi:hypothetical protein
MKFLAGGYGLETKLSKKKEKKTKGQKNGREEKEKRVEVGASYLVSFVITLALDQKMVNHV